MIELINSSTLNSFQRNAEQYIVRLKATGQPEVLTVDGKLRLVVQSIVAYEKLLDQLDLFESTEILRKRLAAMKGGEPGIPAAQVLAEVKLRLGLRDQ